MSDGRWLFYNTPEQEAKNEHARTHCHFCGGACSDTDSLRGARSLSLSNEHAQCRLNYNESAVDWAEDYKEFSSQEARKFLARQAKRAARPQLRLIRGGASE